MSNPYIAVNTYFEVQSGFAFPSHSFVENGIPIVRMSDLKRGHLQFENTKFVDESWLQFASPFTLKCGDFLLGMSGSLTNNAIVKPEDTPALLNQRVGRLKSKRSDTNYDYLCYWLKSEEYTRYADIQGEGAAQKNISAKQIGQFHYRLADIAEQNKIVKILQSIDQTIDKTEALIEKYQQIKAGLMHDLFTRGLTTDGKLRQPREQAPELYQEASIGWIPKEWNPRTCEQLCSRICVGIVIQPTQYYAEDGVPAFRSANIREKGIDPNNLVYISTLSNNLLAKSQVKEGDILSVRTGYPGTSAVVPAEFNGVNCIDILISTPNNEVHSEYLCSWINSSFGKEQVLRQQGGMAQQHFNVGEMRQLVVGLPGMAEQILISTRLKAINDKLQIEQALLEKLLKQKSGLMHELLTGKVPVNVEDTEVSYV